MSAFDPHSSDSTFSRILGKLDAQDKTLEYQNQTLERIESQTVKTNGRVNALEREKWKQRGFMLASSVLIPAAWAILIYMTRK